MISGHCWFSGITVPEPSPSRLRDACHSQRVYSTRQPRLSIKTQQSICTKFLSAWIPSVSHLNCPSLTLKHEVYKSSVVQHEYLHGELYNIWWLDIINNALFPLIVLWTDFKCPHHETITMASRKDLGLVFHSMSAYKHHDAHGKYIWFDLIFFSWRKI